MPNIKLLPAGPDAGLVVERVRTALGCSLNQLSKRSGVSIAHLSNARSGIRGLTSSKVLALLLLLDEAPGTTEPEGVE